MTRRIPPGAGQQPLDGMPTPPPPAPAPARMDDYEAWITHVWPHYEAAADTGQPFRIEQVAAANQLPDPPDPAHQWGALPARLQNAGIIRHHDASGSTRAGGSLVHVWIGIPAEYREVVAARRREARQEARRKAAERRAA